MPRYLIIIAIINFYIAAYFYRPGQKSDFPMGDLFLFLGGAAVLAAFWFARGKSSPITPPTTDFHGYPIRRKPLVFGLTCLLLLAEINGEIFDIPLLVKTVHFHLQMTLFIVGIGLIIIGLTGVSVRSLRFGKIHRKLLLILLLAAGLRLWNLENAVRHPIDEAHMMEAVANLRDNPVTPVLSPFHGIALFPWLYPYLEWWTTAFFGSSLAGLRIAGVITGTLGVWAVYGLAKWLWDDQKALLSALLLATFPPHIHFSRLGLINIADPLLGTLALAFLVRALQTQNRVHYVLSGLCFGLLFYFHEAGKLLYPPVAITWILWMALFGRKRASGRGLCWLVLTTLIVIFPYVYTFHAYQVSLTPRMNERGLNDTYLGVLIFTENGIQNFQTFFRNQIMPPLMHFINLPDISQYFYGGEMGMIIPPIVPLFFVGIFAALWRWRNTGMLLLLVILATTLGNSLMDYPVWTARYAVVFPAIAMSLALAITEIVRMLNTQTNRVSNNIDSTQTQMRELRGALSPFLTLTTVVFVGLIQIAYYFGPHLTLYNHQLRPVPDFVDVIYRTRELPAGTEVFLIYGDIVFLPHFDTYYRFWDVDILYHPIALKDFTLRYLERIRPDGNYAFFVDPRDTRSQQMLAAYWELDGPYRSDYLTDVSTQYVMYLVSSEARRNRPWGKIQQQ